MDFHLTEEQTLLRDTTRDLLRSYDTETRNKVIDTDLGWSPEVWSQMAEIGLLELAFDNTDAGAIEIATIAGELGRRLAPEPFISAVLTPGTLIAEAGSDEQRALLSEVAAGTRLLAFAHAEPGTRWPHTTLTTKAEQRGDDWVISGRKHPVPAGDCAKTLVVSATLPDGGVGLFLVDAEATARQPYRTFDGHRGAQIDLDATPAAPLGAAADASALIGDVTVRTQSALCADALGAMEEALRLTTDYLKARKQFGVPLKTFQTLTQRAADMYISLEMARSMSLYAAMAIADGTVSPVIASRAKLQIGRSARHIGQEAIQLHGGIGVTAEYPVSHYVARLTAIEQTLGSSNDHLHVLIDQLGDYGIVTLDS